MSKELRYQQIKRVEASVGGYFGSTYTVEVDLRDRELNWEQRGWGGEDTFRKTIRHATVDRFLTDLEQINFLKWKRRYIDPKVLDGTQWEVKIILDDKKLEKYGSNAYPEEWEQFCRIIRRMSRKPFQ